MSLHDALRKAAGLLVELPPESPGAAIDTPDLSAGPASPQDRQPLDVGQLLAEQGIGVPKADTPSTAPTTKTVEQIVRDADGPSLDEIRTTVGSAPPAAADTTINAAAIYAAAKLPETAFGAEQLLDMLSSLPPELPLETRRQTVKVALSALGKSAGATQESIVADASRKMAALAAYTEFLTKRTEEFTGQTESEINALQAQIEEKRRAIQENRQRLAQTTHLCKSESEHLDDVLEFFSLDVPPSKYAESSQPLAGQ